MGSTLALIQTPATVAVYTDDLRREASAWRLARSSAAAHLAHCGHHGHRSLRSRLG